MVVMMNKKWPEWRGPLRLSQMKFLNWFRCLLSHPGLCWNASVFCDLPARKWPKNAHSIPSFVLKKEHTQTKILPGQQRTDLKYLNWAKQIPCPLSFGGRQQTGLKKYLPPFVQASEKRGKNRGGGCLFCQNMGKSQGGGWALRQGGNFWVENPHLAPGKKKKSPYFGGSMFNLCTFGNRNQEYLILSGFRRFWNFKIFEKFSLKTAHKI